MIKIFKMVGFGNYYIDVWMGTENKNENHLCIHDNSMGETVYESNEIWDTDLIKIVRFLNEYKYSNLKIKEAVTKLNRICRHLEIPVALI